MKYIWRLLWGYWSQLGLLVGATYGSVMATLSLPDFMAAIINNGIVGTDMAVIWHNGWQMIAVTLAGAVGTIVSVFFATRIATGLCQQLRDQVFARVEDYAVADYPLDE